jgi:hypothetical protein
MTFDEITRAARPKRTAGPLTFGPAHAANGPETRCGEFLPGTSIRDRAAEITCPACKRHERNGTAACADPGCEWRGPAASLPEHQAIAEAIAERNGDRDLGR